MQLKIKRLHPDARIPTYGSDGAACFDLYAVHGGAIPPGGWRSINTGLAVEVPPGFVMKVYSRSGHGFKHGVSLANSVGVVDSDFRGTVHVGLRNDGHVTFEVEPGDRIAQAMIEPAPQVTFVEVDELTDTARGAGGIGSTGT